MGLLWGILLLGVAIHIAVFFLMWNFRGRGFRELVFWRRSASPGRAARRASETLAEAEGRR